MTTTWPATISLSLLLMSAGAAQQPAPPAPPLSPADIGPGNPPPPPPGTERVLSFDKHGTRVAACAQKPGAAIERGGRSFPATEVWITDGTVVWKTGAVAAACDPVWSPDGTKLALVAPDGVWILSDTQQQKGERFTDVRDADTGTTAASGVTFSKPRWSPDGTKLAALVSSGGRSWVEILDVASGKVLAKSAPDAVDFEWSPDSRAIQVNGRTTVTVP